MGLPSEWNKKLIRFGCDGTSVNVSENVLRADCPLNHRYHRLRNWDWKQQAIRVAMKSGKNDKNSLKMEHFSNTFDNISGLKALTNLKYVIPVEAAFC